VAAIGKRRTLVAARAEKIVFFADYFGSPFGSAFFDNSGTNQVCRKSLFAEVTIMNNRIRRIFLPAAFAVSLSIPTCAFAQNSSQDNQPVVGTVHTREADIQRKMQLYFNQGLIDSNELARFQRDFDGICVKEDAARMKQDGLTGTARSVIMKKLDLFEADLDQHASKSGPLLAPPAQPK
jgi:hypothetical protein